jgi:hypothetical protein
VTVFFVQRPIYLWKLLHYYKIYPIIRAAPVNGHKDGRNYMFDIHKWEEHLSAMIDELQPVWDARFNPGNHLPHTFGSQVTGSIDSYPIFISRPPARVQRLYYNGKYAGHVMKVSAESITVSIRSILPY